MTTPSDGPISRVEVITSVQRRRRWSAAEKVGLVEEAMQPGMNPAAFDLHLPSRDQTLMQARAANLHRIKILDRRVVAAARTAGFMARIRPSL